MHQMAVLTSRETLTSRRNGPAGILSWCSTVGNAKSCPWRRTIPCNSTHHQLTDWKVALQKRTWGSQWTGWMWASNAPSWQMTPTVSWAAQGRTPPTGQGKWSLPSQTWWNICSTRPSPRLPSTSEMNVLESPAKGYTDDERTEAPDVWEEAERDRTVQPGEEEAQGRILLSICMNTWEG